MSRDGLKPFAFHPTARSRLWNCTPTTREWSNVSSTRYNSEREALPKSFRITAIQKRNCEMIEQKAYRGMCGLEPETTNVQYNLLPSDNSTLYRKFSRLHGVDVRQKPEFNVDDWLNPASPNFQKAIYDTIFHYSARSAAADRFEVCISTQEMEEAAWKYAHHAQLVLDGTFGICSSRLLLFIALARDDQNPLNTSIFPALPVSKPPPPSLPLPIVPPSIKWDPILIQAMGGDKTTIDNSSALNSETDQTRVAESELDSGDEMPATVCMFPIGFLLVTDCYPWYLQHHNGCAAIQAQIAMKIQHDVQRLLPSLHGLANTLADTREPHKLANMAEFSSVLATIQQYIHIDTSTPNSVQANQHSATVSLSLQSTGKRPMSSCPTLLPPSPERRQKRKDSHAPL